MGTAAIDLSAGLQPVPGGIDLSAGLQPKESKGFFRELSDTSGLSSVASMLTTNPVTTVKNIGHNVARVIPDIQDAYATGQKEGFTSDNFRHAAVRAVPIVGPVAAELAQNVQDKNYAGAAGVVAGIPLALYGPKALKGAGKFVPTLSEATASTAEALQKAGAASESAGNRLVNETVGMYKKDFSRGANGGRGYNSQGLGISSSMSSLASKAEAAKNSVGANIQKVISASGKSGALIPMQDVIDAVYAPIKQAFEDEKSPGGMQNTAPFEQYASGFEDVIQKGMDKGGLTASELFDLKKQVAKKAKFNNTTPEGILDVRQSQVGAIGGLLKSVIPELGPLNQAYQDLVRLSDRAAWRAESGAVGLRKLVTEGSKGAVAAATGMLGGAHEGFGAYLGLQALDSIPSRTAAATTLYRGGKVLANAGSKLEDWLKGKP